MTVRLTPFLRMEGNAKEAIRFYEEALDAQVLSIITYGEMPMDITEELKGKVAHALVKIGESDLMLSDSVGDVCTNSPDQTGDKVSICISTDDAEKAGQLFSALQQDGQVEMPLEETSFSPAFGIVNDKFGVMFTVVAERKQ
ncbi:VOC family protein [Pseudalkalibacillus decolorationis]|uniref:VOC family protein n=1 Tax=Pseudalkalibacillus decolorationis TaxID=163879 RepID=UPI002148B3D6|nr:VOC family protein [Pseudalkalibacillus decolorationis]